MLGLLRNPQVSSSVSVCKMEFVKLLFAILFGLAGFVGSVIILIEAFKDEIWKGILALLCGLYLIWFALFDFDHEHKWLIILLSLFGSGIAAGILAL